MIRGDAANIAKKMRLIVFITALLLTGGVVADLDPIDAGRGFISGLRAYEAGEFEHAAELFEAVMVVQPNCARCAHLLGKSYGRQTEQAGWTEAMRLAKKTRLALEHAVALAPNDARPIEDLIKYYRSAPRFLGGSNKKADELEQRLQRFRANDTS